MNSDNTLSRSEFFFIILEYSDGTRGSGADDAGAGLYATTLPNTPICLHDRQITTRCHSCPLISIKNIHIKKASKKDKFIHYNIWPEITDSHRIKNNKRKRAAYDG